MGVKFYFSFSKNALDLQGLLYVYIDHRMDLKIRERDLGRGCPDPVNSLGNVVLIVNLAAHEYRMPFYLFKTCLSMYKGLALATQRLPEIC